MDFSLNKKEKKLFKIVEDSVKKWREILYLDPLWDIDVTIFDDDMMPGALARVDVSSTEYFLATVEVSYDMFDMKEEEFKEKINEVICHELLHVVSIDFFRSAQLAAGENEVIQKELRYRYEQFTSRLQKTFNKLHSSYEKVGEFENKINEIKKILDGEEIDKIEALKKII